MTWAMPRAMRQPSSWGTMPASHNMTMEALLISSRNSTERPPPRKTSLMSSARGASPLPAFGIEAVVMFFSGRSVRRDPGVLHDLGPARDLGLVEGIEVGAG